MWYCGGMIARRMWRVNWAREEGPERSGSGRLGMYEEQGGGCGGEEVFGYPLGVGGEAVLD
jgi:hypothetical protein